MKWIESWSLPTREDKLLPERVLFLETKKHPRFRTLLFGKEAVKTFCTNVLIRGKWIQSTDIDGNKVVRAVMLLQKFLSRKKLSRKYRSIFGLKNQSCDRRHGFVYSVFSRLDFSEPFLALLFLPFLRSDIFSFWDRTRSDLRLKRRPISKTVIKLPNHFRRVHHEVRSQKILKKNHVRFQKKRSKKMSDHKKIGWETSDLKIKRV